MNHDDFLASYLGSGGEGPAEQDHLASCAECRDVITDLDDTRRTLAEPATWAEPAAGLEDAVVAAISAAAAAAATEGDRRNDRVDVEITVGHADADVDPQGATVVDFAARRASATRRSRFTARASAVVAAAAVIVAAFALAARPSAPTDELAGAVEITLAQTDVLPGASGRARLKETPSGVRIWIDATGLPRRDGTDFYQAWLRGERGLVPIGTFHSGEDVTLWAGVDLDEFPTLTVTQESADGNQESSGRRVLVGTLAKAPPTSR